MTNAFVHCELSTDDVARAREFYQRLFSWKLQQLGPEMGNYVMIDLGKADSGGGMTAKMMPNMPTGWLPYVEVASVKDTIAKAQAGGATIIVPFQPVGSMGAIGIFIDPTGAWLGVWESTKPAKRAPKAAGKRTARNKSASKKASAKKARKKK
jgi:uncharacterized protein